MGFVVTWLVKARYISVSCFKVYDVLCNEYYCNEKFDDLDRSICCASLEIFDMRKSVYFDFVSIS